MSKSEIIYQVIKLMTEHDITWQDIVDEYIRVSTVEIKEGN